MDASIEDTSIKSDKLLSQYKQSLDEEFERYKESAMQESKYLKKSKINSTKQQLRKSLAKEQMEIKRKITNKQNLIKTEIFAAVTEKLDAYRKTPDYAKSLEKQILGIKAKYAAPDMIVYISAEDEALIDEIKSATGADIAVSEVPFIGGIKAVMPSQNMLIDLSYKTKLMEAEEQFTFTV